MAVKTLAELKALWIKGYRPTEADFDDLFDTIFSVGGAWTKKVLNLTQADVVAMATNFQFEAAPGANKVLQIANPVIVFTADGITNLTDVRANIFNESGSVLFSTLGMHITPAANGHVQGFYIGDGSGNPAYEKNEALLINATSSVEDFTGSAKLIYDYRILDLS